MCDCIINLGFFDKIVFTDEKWQDLDMNYKARFFQVANQAVIHDMRPRTYSISINQSINHLFVRGKYNKHEQ